MFQGMDQSMYWLGSWAIRLISLSTNSFICPPSSRNSLVSSSLTSAGDFSVALGFILPFRLSVALLRLPSPWPLFHANSLILREVVTPSAFVVVPAAWGSKLAETKAEILWLNSDVLVLTLMGAKLKESTAKL